MFYAVVIAVVAMFIFIVLMGRQAGLRALSTKVLRVVNERSPMSLKTLGEFMGHNPYITKALKWLLERDLVESSESGTMFYITPEGRRYLRDLHRSNRSTDGRHTTATASR